MEFGLWEKYYTEILEDFGFSRQKDEESAKLLDEILSTEGCLTLNDLSEIVGFSDKFIVFGAGPSVKEHVQMLKEEYDLKDYVLVAADGATTAMIEEKISPDIVATDLDGNIDDIVDQPQGRADQAQGPKHLCVLHPETDGGYYHGKDREHLDD